MAEDIRQQLEEVVSQLKEQVGPRGEAAPDLAPMKIIVAVHGIGDQSAFETARSVADRFCAYMGLPVAIPLGWFHNAKTSFLGAYIPTSDLKWFPDGLGFTEVYWADVPRGLVTKGYTLEEAR